MLANIEVKSGLLMGRRFDVQSGERITVGRSDDAGFCVAQDPKLAELHFEIASSPEGCLLTSLRDDAPTFVNGEPVGSAPLAAGDRITAGHTQFLVVKLTKMAADDLDRTPRPGAAAKPPAAGAAVAATPRSAPAPAEPERSGPELLAWLDQDEEVREKAAPGRTAAELLDQFTAEEAWPVAIRLQAHLLPARGAVWWGCLCLRELFGGEIPDEEKPCLEVAMRWVADPSEENRRVAEKEGQPVEEKGLAAWLCLSAFWSQGSLAPADYPEVKPDRRLTGRGITGCLMMAAPHGDPAKAPDRYRAFLALGKRVMAGEVPFPA